MPLTGLAAVFGAALAPLAADGVLHATTLTDDGVGGFSATATDVPVKVVVDAASERDRIAGGLPAGTVTLTVFRAGLGRSIAVDDAIAVGPATYRVIGVTRVAGEASFSVTGVPA